MMKILLDTNIILDIALKREPHFTNSATVFSLIEQYGIEAFISATSINDIYYIARKEKGNEAARAFITELTKVVSIAGINKHTVLNALQSDIADFEDALQNFAAMDTNCDYIITRNKPDFRNANLTVLTPMEFIETINDIHQK